MVVQGSKILGFYPQITHLENNLFEIHVLVLEKALKVLL